MIRRQAGSYEARDRVIRRQAGSYEAEARETLLARSSR
ncbi:hypothetical protein ppKF707_1278 [Metapseudomonas furukawaii]|nr:hypothetical protein ppKF707_1278 [Pseudomonas furukawaii]